MKPIDLKGDLRRLAIDSLIQAGAAFSPTDDLERLLLAVFTLEERLITPVPRKVCMTPEFERALTRLSKSERTAADELIGALEQGHDVSKRLSKLSRRPNKTDDLLVDWGLHHFHLGADRSENKRVTGRTVLLGFAHITPSHAYLVDIRGHDSFAEPQLVELLFRNFPEVAAKHKIRGIDSLSHPAPASSAEVKKMRRARVNTLRQIDGEHFFGPGPGFMASGHSFNAVRRLNVTMHKIDALERALMNQMPKVHQAARKVIPDIALSEMEFGLIYENGESLVHEKRTGLAFRFVQEPARIRG